MPKAFLWLFSQTFGLAYSPLSSAKLSCSSEVTLKKIEGPNRERDQSTTETFTLQTFSHRSNAKVNIILGTYQEGGLIRDNLQLVYAHFMYRILDSKKTSHLHFIIPGLRYIHRNLKQQKNFNPHDGLFRKSPFCTFSCINPGFGGPWGML